MTSRNPFEDKHLVIGAGFTGLGMARALREAGIAYDQVEAADRVGGNWYQGVYQHVHIVSSKATTEFPGYPMPADYPPFPSAAQMHAYLESFATHFQLYDQLELRRRVSRAEPTGTDQWTVTFEDGEVRRYRGVIVCNGHHWKAKLPSYPGHFTGQYFHSAHYKTTDVLVGRRVLVIGAGNSACDIAVDAAREAASADISIRSGTWILPKTVFGAPLMDHLHGWVPQAAQRAFVKLLVRLFVGDYRSLGLPIPAHDVYDKHPTINSLLPYYLRHGRVHVRPAIQSWHERTVTFVDGTSAEYDLIIAATGFDVAFPFLPAGLVPVERAVPQLPMGSFPERVRGLYILGWMQPRLGVGPLVEAGAPAICELIKAQAHMRHPVGAVLRRLGIGIPTTHVADGHQLIRQMKLGRPLIRHLPTLERLLLGDGPRPPTTSVVVPPLPTYLSTTGATHAQA
jgi:hypothetical protein